MATFILDLESAMSKLSKVCEICEREECVCQHNSTTIPLASHKPIAYSLAFVSKNDEIILEVLAIFAGKNHPSFV